MTLLQKTWAVGLLVCATLLLLPHRAAACSGDFYDECETRVLAEAENCWDYCIWIRECEGYEVAGGVCTYDENGCLIGYGGYSCECLGCYI